MPEIPMIKPVDMKYARVMLHRNPPIKVHIGIWKDGAVTSCAYLGKEKGGEIEWEGKGCYTTEPGQEEAGWAFIYHLVSHDFEEHHIPTE